MHLCKPQKGGLSEVMLLNDLENDIKIKCIENDTTQIGLAEKIGKTGQYVNRIVKKNGGVLNKTFIQMMEGLGYDIQLLLNILNHFFMSNKGANHYED